MRYASRGRSGLQLRGRLAQYLLASLDQSLERMGLDYVDIVYSHRFDPDTPLEETMGALASAAHQGRALYVGISSYSPELTRDAAGLMPGAVPESARHVEGALDRPLGGESLLGAEVRGGVAETGRIHGGEHRLTMFDDDPSPAFEGGRSFWRPPISSNPREGG